MNRELKLSHFSLPPYFASVTGTSKRIWYTTKSLVSDHWKCEDPVVAYEGQDPSDARPSHHFRSTVTRKEYNRLLDVYGKLAFLVAL